MKLFTFDSFDELIETINKNEKPLASYYFGSIFGKNYQRLEKETSSGMFAVNECVS